MIISALSALDLQGKKHLLTSFWLIDSAASNRMTGSPAALQDVRKCGGKQHISQMAVLFLLLRLKIWGHHLLLFSCLLIYLPISFLLDN